MANRRPQYEPDVNTYRGRCPECTKIRQLKLDGNLRTHSDGGVPRAGCAGSNRRPTQTWDPGQVTDDPHVSFQRCPGCDVPYFVDCNEPSWHDGCPHTCTICSRLITNHDNPFACRGHTVAEVRAFEDLKRRKVRRKHDGPTDDARRNEGRAASATR